MKKAFFLIIIIGFFIYCNAQLSYEHLFDFELLENGYPVGIRVFDYNNDNIDEISFVNRCDSMWIFYVYEQNGNQIMYHEEILNENEYLGNYGVYSDSTDTYFISATLSGDALGYYYITLRKYELFSFSLISEYSFSGWDTNAPIYAVWYFDGVSISIIHENNTCNLNLGMKFVCEDPWWPGGEYIEYIEHLCIFQVSNQFELLGEIPDCNSVQTISKIGIGNYKSVMHNMNGTYETDFHGWIKQISYDNIPCANTVWEDTLSVKLLTTNDNTFFEYGAIFYHHEEYFCIDPELNEILWESSYSNFYGVGPSSNLFINNENHYLLYSCNNHFEIRDRIDGSILHFEESSLYPRKILKTQNDQILFIEYSYYNDYGSIYKLTDINFVNVLDNEIIQNYSSITNHPNPFNPTTTIEFSIQNDAEVELSIYNIKGQTIKTLVNNDFTKGSHSIIWNGDDESGDSVSSGVYLYKLNVNGKVEAVKKCLLLK